MNWQFSATFMATLEGKTFSCMDVMCQTVQKIHVCSHSSYPRSTRSLSILILDLAIKSQKRQQPAWHFSTSTKCIPASTRLNPVFAETIRAPSRNTTFQLKILFKLVLISVDHCWSTSQLQRRRNLLTSSYKTLRIYSITTSLSTKLCTSLSVIRMSPT